jgi:hypothetical protein
MKERMTEATARDVAQWMLADLKRQEYLYQNEVVYEIGKRFGARFTYTNENGNLAIDQNVLKEFRQLTADNVTWERGERMWRFRKESDDPGRAQDN